jgi:hypothetical protein
MSCGRRLSFLPAGKLECLQRKSTGSIQKCKQLMRNRNRPLNKRLKEKRRKNEFFI